MTSKLRLTLSWVGVLCLASSLLWAGSQKDSIAHKVAGEERAAVGGDAWNRIGALVLKGTVTEGGQPNPFEEVIDLHSGHSRVSRQIGSIDSFDGFDGELWSSVNGVVVISDLPGLVQDARTLAWMNRAGWRQKHDGAVTLSTEASSDEAAVVHYKPAGGTDVALTFDPKTHLLKQSVVDAEGGLVTTLYSDWHDVSGIKYPFRQEQTDATGEVTIYQVKELKALSKTPAGSLDRPVEASHAQAIPGGKATVPFKFTGASQAHIVVDADVNGISSKLIFDTGGANYFSPAAAQRLGLEVSGGVNLSGVGESSNSGGYASIRRISLGDATLHDEASIVGPLPWPASTGAPEGSVGLEFLAEFRTIIDYKEKTLSFESFHEPPPKDAIKLHLYIEGHSPCVEAMLDGHRGIFRIDTGDGDTITLFPKFAQTNDLYQTEQKASIQGGGMGGQVRASRVTYSDFSFAGREFHELPGKVSMTKAGSFNNRTIAGNMGGGVLRCFRVTLDYRAHLAYFEPYPDSTGCGEPTPQQKR